MEGPDDLFERRYRRLRQEKRDGWNAEALAQSMYDLVCDVLRRDGVDRGALLDLGCGDGKLTLRLAQSGWAVCGIDISPTAVAWARERSRALGIPADFRAGNVLDLPFRPGNFDVAVDSFCFHCIIGADRRRFLSETFRVLKRDGVLIILSKCGSPKDPDYPFDPITRCKIENGRPTRYWGLPADIVAEIRAAGFAVADSRVFPHEQDLLVVNARRP